MANSLYRVASAAGLAIALAILLPSGPAAAQVLVLGSDAAACHSGVGGTAALVIVEGFRDRAGRLRVQYYGDNPDDYLASGKYLRREEMPVTAAGDMAVCITLPGPGRYAMVALHDRDSDGRLSIFSDGIGFSNNPKLVLAKPKAEKTLFTAGPGVTTLHIVLNYWRGLSVRPWRE
jgi:uncharacterized protein (DUF2141 family)